ncbi:MAG: DNA/RNA non-specific endonuclease [Hyalangium sp.]|uniref:DNA/RNA non-specific endonuclease n=1 Tax=Hyalangium sp. TaxID=2028555 RepID=UPI00389A513F
MTKLCQTCKFLPAMIATEFCLRHMPKHKARGKDGLHDKMFDIPLGVPRPAWAGLVKITGADGKGLGKHNGQNASGVEGVIVPITTRGRGKPPEPNSRQKTGNSQGTDKGHLMALQLGGPDRSENIIAQPSDWQRTGFWRKMETAIYHFACTLMNANQAKESEFPLTVKELQALAVAKWLRKNTAPFEPKMLEHFIMKALPTPNYVVKMNLELTSPPSGEKLYNIGLHVYPCDKQGGAAQFSLMVVLEERKNYFDKGYVLVPSRSWNKPVEINAFEINAFKQLIKESLYKHLPLEGIGDVKQILSALEFFTTKEPVVTKEQCEEFISHEQVLENASDLMVEEISKETAQDIMQPELG